ncbi:glycosyl hydrolase 108 family protein [Mesorhizobium sp. 1M-11]|uniref:glycoside hydrolase family 108 protein n=1 Tax=Mesorhizobium sp. 1M-11 TaxID=1529006 RepID=UPI0006C75D53|nr:glycosyl hydrolase 108 family protein [Mesorhizobium sp. 1M-11]
MRENFQKCLQVTLAYEGGWADNPKDPGGATMKGITLATYQRFLPGATKTQLRNISAENVAKIYRQDYWQAVNADTLAAGVDLATFDGGVMSGPPRSKKWLLASLGGSDDQTVKKICAKRLGFVQSLKIWKTFGKGWARRIAAIEAKGVAWALAATQPAATVKAKLLEEEKGAKGRAGNNAVAATGVSTATGAGGSDAVVNPQHVDMISGWALAGVAVLAVGVIVLLVVRAKIHNQRAAAYAAEAEAIGAA